MDNNLIVILSANSEGTSALLSFDMVTAAVMHMSITECGSTLYLDNWDFDHGIYTGK